MTALPCTNNVATGKRRNFSGQLVDNCADCWECNSAGFKIEQAIIAGSVNFRVVSVGMDFRLVWDCPRCGGIVNERCSPIDAIPLSDEVSRDPLCYACRVVDLSNRYGDAL